MKICSIGICLFYLYYQRNIVSYESQDLLIVDHTMWDEIGIVEIVVEEEEEEEVGAAANLVNL